MEDPRLLSVDVEAVNELALAAEHQVTRSAGPAVARKAIRLVLSAYRTPDLFDPAAFVELAVQAIEDFPECIIVELASPKTGIIRDSKFCPTIAEIVKFCDDKRTLYLERTGFVFKRIANIEQAKQRAELELRLAADKARADAEWKAQEPERHRKAAEAEKAIREAAIRRDIEDAKRRKEADARAAWTKAMFARFANDGQVLERLYSLTEDEQLEATKRELDSPGAGSAYLIERIAS